MARRSDNRGFGSMDPERRRRIASEGGRSSRGGRNRDYEDEYDQDYDEDYDEDEDRRISNKYRDEDWDEGYEEDEDEYGNAGYEDEDEYDEDEVRGRGYSTGGRRTSVGRRGSSRRGFGGMDPEEQRRIARMRGEATSRTHGRDFYEDIGHEGGEAVRDEYGPEFYSRMGRRGGRARWEEDEDYDRDRGRGRRSSSGGTRRSTFDRGRESSSRSGSSSGGRRSTSSGRRGFGSMPREEVRRIARIGGRARWSKDYDDRGRGRGYRGR